MRTPRTFEEKTECILETLLSEFLDPSEQVQGRCFQSDVPDSGTATSFDPTIIAGRLRMIGDQINRELEDSIKKVTEEATKGQAVAALRDTVQSLSQTWCAHDSSLVYEKAFLGVTVKVLEFISQKMPQYATQLARNMRDLINGNTAVREYIESQGGWENLEN